MSAGIACRWLAVLTLFGTCAAAAQPFPNKPLRIIIPFTASGTNDILARLLAPKLLSPKFDTDVPFVAG